MSAEEDNRSVYSSCSGSSQEPWGAGVETTPWRFEDHQLRTMSTDERRKEYEALAAISASYPHSPEDLDALRQRYARSPRPDSPQSSTASQNPHQFQEGGSQPQSHRLELKNPSLELERGDLETKNNPAAPSAANSRISLASRASRGKVGTLAVVAKRKRQYPEHGHCRTNAKPRYQ